MRCIRRTAFTGLIIHQKHALAYYRMNKVQGHLLNSRRRPRSILPANVIVNPFKRDKVDKTPEE
jgi:hypothetical protein